MSILNLGLQFVGLVREQMPDEYEREVAKCNNLSELRKHLTGNELVVKQSLSPVKTLLNQIFSRLKLHDEHINVFSSATSSELNDFWSVIVAIDATLSDLNANYRQDTMHRHQRILLSSKSLRI